MGSEHSHAPPHQPTAARFDGIRSPFSTEELAKLIAKYRQLRGTADVTGAARIDESAFVRAMGFSDQRIGRIAFRAVDRSGSGRVSLSDFVAGLSEFHCDAPARAKAEHIFAYVDARRRGTVSQSDVREFAAALLERNAFIAMDEPMIEHFVAELFREFDSTKSGEMTVDDFVR